MALVWALGCQWPGSLFLSQSTPIYWFDFSKTSLQANGFLEDNCPEPVECHTVWLDIACPPGVLYDLDLFPWMGHSHLLILRNKCLNMDEQYLSNLVKIPLMVALFERPLLSLQRCYWPGSFLLCTIKNQSRLCHSSTLIGCSRNTASSLVETCISNLTRIKAS